MIKVTLVVAGLLAVSLAAVVPDAAGGRGHGRERATVEGCLYENELWGSEDGTKFYFCLPGTNTAVEQSCPSNTFFVKNATVSGCLPLDKVSTQCVYLKEVEPEPCEGVNLMQPQTSQDPTAFYLCTGGTTPVKLSCPDGKAFVNQDGYLGCFAWAEWRAIRDCPE